LCLKCPAVQSISWYAPARDRFPRLTMIPALLQRSGLSRENVMDTPPHDANAREIPSKVLVTGAGGRTGCIVVRKLLELGVGPAKQFSKVRAMVRSQESAERVSRAVGGLMGVETVIGDLTSKGSLDEAFRGMDAVVVCTSAQPRLCKVSLAKTIAMQVVTLGHVVGRPEFWFDEGLGPEQIDWLGQKAQFEAAEAAGVKHIVLVSSMCGTRPQHFLNTHMENLVLWKRKAECALVRSGVPYTIIHPGGLLPHSGGLGSSAEGRKRQLCVGVDDELLDDKAKAMVTREDLAEVCVRCLLEPAVSVGRSFDLGSWPEGEGTPFEGRVGELKALLETLGGRNATYREADAAFVALESRPERACLCF